MTKKLTELLGAFPLGEYIPSMAWIDRIRGVDTKLEEIHNKIDGFLERVVQQHVEAGEGSLDFVDILLSVQRDKTTSFELGRSSLKFLLLDMFIAASINIFTVIEWAMTEICRHPECMKKLQDEIRSTATDSLYISENEVQKMNYLSLVIKETLRLHPPGPLIPRLLKEDVKLNGYDVVGGTQVLINVWAIQRDNATWGPDAEEFRLDRHLDSLLNFQGLDFTYFPFGSGRRLCPGIGFGLTFLEVTLANLVNRFDWRPLGDDKPDIVEAMRVEACRKFPLIVYPSSVL